MLRLLGAPFGHAGDGEPDGRRVLLAPVPGEQHAFGISVVEALMRRSGWDVEVAWNFTEARLAAAVRAEHYDLIGLSLSGDILLPALRSTIQTIRRASGNRMAKIIVGGRYFIENPDMVERVGADAGAVDARDAILQADRLVAVPVASR
jgi:methanogenic corrinoid protein MtbC1